MRGRVGLWPTSRLWAREPGLQVAVCVVKAAWVPCQRCSFPTSSAGRDSRCAWNGCSWPRWAPFLSSVPRAVSGSLRRAPYFPGTASRVSSAPWGHRAVPHCRPPPGPDVPVWLPPRFKHRATPRRPLFTPRHRGRAPPFLRPEQPSEAPRGIALVVSKPSVCSPVSTPHPR